MSDMRWMFRAFRIGFTITGHNYSAALQDVTSREYKTTAAEIFARVSLFEASGVAGQGGPRVQTPLSCPVGSMQNVKIR